MDTDGLPTKKAHVIFVGNKGSGKSSLYQCLKSPNPHVIDVPPYRLLVEEWNPFDLETSPVAEECRKYFDESALEKDYNAIVHVWDICGYESLWSSQQLCIPTKALFVLVFNVRNPMGARLVPQWVQMIQAKSLGAHIIVAASNCEISEDGCQNVLKEVEKAESAVLAEIEEELSALRELNCDVWVKNRIEKLEKIAQNRPNVCSTVFLTSAVTGKGLGDLRCAILKHLFDVEKFPSVHQTLNAKEMNLVEKVRSRHDGKSMVMSLEDYQDVASSVGLDDKEELEQATNTLAMKGFLARVNIAGSFDEPDTSVIITDPCCFASACAMVHRDEENPQDFVNKLQKSHHVQRFWPTSTRPNDWTLRSAIEDVVSRGMVRESFLPLCWQVWDVNEDDIKKLLPVMIKLGVLVDGAPKASYEIELALSYFKNLSVTKRYHLPLLLKLPKEPPEGVWPEKIPDSSVSVSWKYKFQDGLSEGLLLCILAACKNYKSGKMMLAHWQTGVIIRTGVVDVRIMSIDQAFDLSARCPITNGNKQALNIAWVALADFIYVTETYLSNFPGLYYQLLCPFNSSKTIYQLMQDYITNNESHLKALWIFPPLDVHSTKEDESSVPTDVLTWSKKLLGHSSIYVSHRGNQSDEVKLLASQLEQFGFDVALQGSLSEDRKLAIDRCPLIILFLTKSYVDDPCFQDDITLIQSSNKRIIAARFEADLSCELPDVVWVDLNCGSGDGISYKFDSTQLSNLVTECQSLIYGSGHIEPLFESSEPADDGELSKTLPANEELPETLPAPSLAPSMEPSKAPESAENERGLKKAEKKKVQFSTETDNNNRASDDSQIKPLAACTVAAAIVGAAAEHLSRSRKASSAGTRAASATAKVARAVANGDAAGATEAMNDVVRIVDGLSSSCKQKENGYGPPPKSKTCAIL